MVTATNLIVGARDLTVDSVNIGALVGGVEVLYESEKFLHRVDQHMGVLAIDKIDETVRVRVRMGESTLENLRIAMGQPSWALSQATSLLHIGSETNVPQHALVITGKAPGATDKTRTITIPKAVVEEGGTHSYTKDGRTEYEVTFMCLVNSSLDAGWQIMTIQDSAGKFAFSTS